MMQDPGILRATLSVIFVATLAHIDNSAAAQTPGSFGKLTPTNGAAGQAPILLLQWQASSGATSYQYCVDATINSTCDGNLWLDLSNSIGVIPPPLAALVTYEWQVRARNSSGQTEANGGQWWTFATRLLPPNTYFYDDLETSALGWGATGTWGVTTESAHTPTHAWSDSPNGSYQPDAAGAILSPQIDLRQAKRPLFTFWHRHEFAIDGVDRGRLRISTDDGNTLTELLSFTGTSGGWQQVTVDLSAYVGTTVRVAFDVVSNSTAQADGWYIDDIRVGEPAFTDDPLISGVTPVRTDHLNELRVRINALRGRYGLAVFSWTETIVPAATLIRLQHINELRQALLQVYTAISRTAPSFTDPTIVPNVTLIRAAHIQELRSAVIAIE
jgi:hypothetical protein